jgi:hypothetical protein
MAASNEPLNFNPSFIIHDSYYVVCILKDSRVWFFDPDRLGWNDELMEAGRCWR